MWGKRKQREIDRELRFHIESQVEDNLRAGMTPAEARREALILFGGPAQVREECWELRPFAWLATLVSDLRYAVRTLRASPLFSLAAVVSIALGIGANAAIFTLLHAALWKPLPVPRSAELYHLLRTDHTADEFGYSWPLFAELRDAVAPYGTLIARGSARPHAFTAAGSSQERVIGESVSGAYFATLGIKPSAGRLIAPADDQSPQAFIVLSHSFWARRFHSDNSIIGKTVQYDEQPFRVLGVAQPGFSGIDAGIPTDVWVPVLSADKRFVAGGINTNWMSLLLRTGNQSAAQAAVDARFERHVREELLPQEISQRYVSSLKSQRIQLRPAAGGLASEGRPYRRALLVLMAIVASVLLIACANVANLLLARNISRRREIGVRVALGAGRARLSSQVLSESLVIAFVGAAIGLLTAAWGSRLLLQLLPPSRIPLELDLAPDATVLGFALLATVATALLCAIGPVLRVWRSGLEGLHDAGQRVTERRFGRTVLVAGQIALSLVLVAGAGLFLKTLYLLATTDLGFQPASVSAFELSFPRAAAEEHRARIGRQVLDTLNAREGISATYCSPGIYTGGGWSTVLRSIDDKPLPSASDNEVQLLAVGPRFFETVGIRLLAGRTLDAHDYQPTPPVMVVNQSFARKYFGTASAVGHIVLRNSTVRTEIVGVVRDVKHMGVKGRVWPVMYLPQFQVGNIDGTLLVRSGLGLNGLKPLVASELKQADPAARIEYSSTLDAAVDSMISRERLIAYLSAAFGGLAVLLAAVGLYGLMAYNMVRRTSEIGIRMALGARPADIRRLALAESFKLTSAGMLVGIPVALAAGRLIRGLLYDMRPTDPWILGASALAMVAVTFLAAWLPAARAARIDPNSALRQG